MSYADSETDNEVCDWETKYNEQRRYTDKIVARCDAMKLNENALNAKLKVSEEYNKLVLAELNTYKVEVEEKNNTIKQLKLNLKCKEEELCNVQKKLIDAQNQCGTDFKHLRTELADAKSQTREMGKKLKIEREILSDKLTIVCNKFHETKCAFDETKCVMNADLSCIKCTVAETMKLINEEKNKYDKMELQVTKLIEENCRKDECLLRINKKIEELQRNNECNMNRQIKKLQDWKLKESKKDNCQ